MSKTTNLIYNWKFKKADYPNAHEPSFAVTDWETIRVPHDFAIGGPFSPDNDLQIKEVVADGITTPIKHVGRTGGLPISGTAWYRRDFFVQDDSERVFLEFDGVMSHSSVYVNGAYVGGRVYGYSSFSLDITDYITRGADNVLAVKVCPPDNTSRWYPGAGIYRDVRLVEKSAVYIPYCGTYVTTKLVDGAAEITYRYTVKNYGDKPQITISTVIISPRRERCGFDVNRFTVGASKDFQNEFIINYPILWSTGKPSLYRIITQLSVGSQLVDEYTTSFGIRTIRFDANDGFFLNNRAVKLKGVCLHHDLGALGAAFNVSSARRQLEKMKEMGVNAIRTSHNPPAPQLLDLCDEIGLLVIDEAFDEWRVAKVDNGYSKHFDDCAVDDMRDFVRRDRNHPCVIMWSIGNEIPDQHLPDGAKTAKLLCDICHTEDPTRPTTAGFDRPEAAIKNGLADEVDIVGFNYKPHLYKKIHEQYPHWIIYGSETASCVSSRGVYFFPAEVEVPVIERDVYHTTSYDLAAPPWATLAETEFSAQDDCPFVLGEFVWTGFDYLGEPTPYRIQWPCRSSFFGIFDLCGIPKDRYFSYRSKWSHKDTLHLLPHWNWEDGQKIDVHCYTSHNAAELFLNGRSLGVQEKTGDGITRYRLVWKDVPFEKGTLRAVAVGTSSTGEGCSDEVRTAGTPYAIALRPERTQIESDGCDLCYIEADVVDENDLVCPTAGNKINITVSGAGEYVASDAGDQTSLRIFSEPHCDAFSGRCMIIVRGIKDTPGIIQISVTSDGLKPAAVEITAGK